MMMRAGVRGGCLRGGLSTSSTSSSTTSSMLLAARPAIAAGAQREYALHTFSPPPLPNSEKPVPPVVGAPPPPPSCACSVRIFNCLFSLIQTKSCGVINRLHSTTQRGTIRPSSACSMCPCSTPTRQRLAGANRRPWRTGELSAEG
jgi:hypothetical protein